MTIPKDKTLTLIEVARLVFRTKSPSEAQVARVQKLLQSGLVRECQCAGPPAQWTTTTAGLADYLAQESLKRQAAKQATDSGKPSPTQSLFDGSVQEEQNTTQLKSLYKGLWSEYFLTVFMQRKAVNRSANFKRAVLAGQIMLLLGLIFAMVAGVRRTAEAVPPQRAAVQRWIEANTEKYSIRAWHPPIPATNGEGVVLRVEYSYQSPDSSKPVLTDRSFLVIDDEASLIVESD